MTRFPEKITTERLVLAFYDGSEADEIFERYAQDPEVTRHLGRPQHQSVADTKKMLAEMITSRNEGTSFGWLIRERKSPVILGMIGLRLEGHRAELGYTLGRYAWGNGYMTEAARAVIDAALADDAIWRVYALCNTENIRSRRVLEKLDFRLEGVLRRHCVLPNHSPTPRDVYCYAVTRD